MRMAGPIAQFIAFIYFFVSSAQVSQQGVYSLTVCFVSKFDANVLVLLFFILGCSYQFYFRINYIFIYYTAFLLIGVCTFILLPTYIQNISEKNVLNIKVPKLLFYFSSLEGPSLLHGVSFIVTVCLLVLLFFKNNSKYQSFSGKHKWVKEVLLLLSMYTFYSGAFWAFFSAVWGNWYNNDPVEIFYIFMFLLTLHITHMRKVNRLLLTLATLYTLYFLVCLRTGFLNSKHSNSVFTETTQPWVTAIAVPLLITLPWELLLWYFIKNTHSSYLNLIHIKKPPQAISSKKLFPLYFGVVVVAILIPVLYASETWFFLGLSTHKTYTTICLFIFIFYVLSATCNPATQILNLNLVGWAHVVFMFSVIVLIELSWVFFVPRPYTIESTLCTISYFFKKSCNSDLIVSSGVCFSKNTLRVLELLPVKQPDPEWHRQNSVQYPSFFSKIISSKAVNPSTQSVNNGIKAFLGHADSLITTKEGLSQKTVGVQLSSLDGLFVFVCVTLFLIFLVTVIL